MDSLYRTIDTEVQQPLVGTVCKGKMSFIHLEDFVFLD